MEEPEVHLLDYLKVIYNRKWLILSIMMIAMAVGGFQVYRATPVYRTVCTIRIGEQTNTIIHSGQVVQYTNPWSTEKSINTHIHVMVSDPVLEEVARSLHTKKQSNGPASPGSLKGFFTIDPLKDTNLIRIKATHADPNMAQDLANAMALTYQDFTLRKRMDASQNNVLWLKKEITDLKQKMEEADYNLYQYKQKSHLLSLQKETKMQAEELSQLRSTYNQTRVNRLEIEAKIDELNRIVGSKDKHIPAFLADELLPTLNSQLVETKLEYAQLRKKYGPKHPRMIAVRSTIDSIQTQINQNIRKAINSLQSEHAVLLAKEKALDGSIERYTKKAMDTEQKQIQYALLERETQLNKELYDILVAKLKEVNITEGLEKPEVTIVEKAELPRAPLGSDRNRTLAMAAVIGLVLSLGLAFFLEYLDVGLSTREEAEKYLDLPVLGVIPRTQTRS
jgi:succinoglycan biosynthesis transport protein ExoP